MRKRNSTVVALLSCLLVAGAADELCAAAIRFRLSSRTATISSAGLKTPTLQDATAKPLASPNVHSYRNRSTGDVIDMFEPRELWYRSEHLGAWVDRYGNKYAMARITAALPTGFPQEHVTKAQFADALAKSGDAGRWSLARLTSWAEAFCAERASGAADELQAPFRMARLVEFKFSGARLAYAFQMKRNSYWEANDKWFFVTFELTEGVVKEDAAQLVRKRFFPAMTPIKIAASSDTGHSRALQDRRYAGGEKSSEFAASRADVIASIRNMKDWWYVETKNYIIVSNLSTRDRQLMRRLQKDIDYLRSAYEQFMPAHRPITAVSVVRVFGSSKEYVDYVGESMRWTAGVWISRKKELVINPFGSGHGVQDIGAVLRTVYHEAFHQYLFYAFGRLPTSVWYNEGHAEFYETSAITQSRLSVGENSQHLSQLMTAIRSGDAGVVRMLGMSYEEFYAKGRRSRNYAVAWGLVYYLRKGAVVRQQNPYAQVLDRYSEAIQQKKNPTAATAAAFAGIDMKEFEADFIAFWKSSQVRRTAERQRRFRAYSGK